jgi:hypothetical protein
MDCAISELASSAAGAQSAGGATLCEQGKRFAELLQQAPTSAGQAHEAGSVSSIADTYVPTSTSIDAGSSSTGGSILMSAVEQLRSLTLPGPTSTHGASPVNQAAEGDLPIEGTDPATDLGMVMEQSVAWQAEILRISMLSDMVSSANKGVNTLFQQQG